MTVVTAAPLPAGLDALLAGLEPAGVRDALAGLEPRAADPAGGHDLHLHGPTEDETAATLITFDLKAARPFVRPRPDGKPEIGATVVTTEFQVVSPQPAP